MSDTSLDSTIEADKLPLTKILKVVPVLVTAICDQVLVATKLAAVVSILADVENGAYAKNTEPF